MSHHLQNIAQDAAGFVVIFGLVALLWRSLGRSHTTRVIIPPGRLPGRLPGSGGRTSPWLKIAGVVGGVLVFFYYWGKDHPAAAAKAAPRFAPSPAPTPSTRVITHTITHTVTNTIVKNAHSLLNGWQVVVICLIGAAVLFGGLRLASRWAP